MHFKKLRGVNRSYAEQGNIFFTCRNYAKQPKHIREKIRRLCKECGGPHEEALFAMMTRDVSAEWIEQTYFVSDSMMYNLRKKFYERW